MNIKIYHNPRCSKSRQTLALLNEQGIEPQTIEYLKTPPSATELTLILKLLNISPRELMRKGEKLYKELNLDDSSLSQEHLVNAMIENPVLIERPIVVKGHTAIIGRPPENVLTLIQPTLKNQK